MDEQNSASQNAEDARSADTLDGTSILSHSEGLLEASQAFEHQMEQMQRWKQQLAGQMELVRKDGLKLLERQKRLAQEREALLHEREALSHERAALVPDRESIVRERDTLTTLRTELETKIAAVQEQDGILKDQIAQAQADRVETAQLESQRSQIRDDLRAAEEMLEEATLQQQALEEQTQSLAQRTAAAETRERSALETEQRVLLQETQARAMAEQVEAQRREFVVNSQKVEERSHKLETLEQELAEQMLLIAQQTKRLAERRAASDSSNAAAVTVGDDLRVQLESATRERDAHEARIRHLVTEINDTQTQVATLQSESILLSQQAQRAEELTRDKRAADERAATLATELERLSGELDAAREKLRLAESAPASTSPPGTSPDAEILERRCAEFEAQLAKASAQLKETLDFVDLQAAEAALAKTTLDASAADWQKEVEALEVAHVQEKATLTQEIESLRSAPGAAPGNAPQPSNQPRQRSALVRQVRSLRHKRKKNRELVVTLESTRTELGKQLQQVRVRRDNLEQVKRLLEKQETVMARKLADHNALKTVAAVGIFLIMILGSTFLGVYRFVNPEFRGEALVQLTPPADMPPEKIEPWLQAQATALRADPTVLQTAWGAMRQESYAMHDSKESWINSLPTDLALQIDPASKSIALRVKGNSADGVSSSSNALANAFAQESKEKLDSARPENLPAAAASAIIAKATVPAAPIKDQRLVLALGTAGALMVLALLGVFVVRKLISRQLKEIDQMADAKDLEDLHDDMSVDRATT